MGCGLQAIQHDLVAALEGALFVRASDRASARARVRIRAARAALALGSVFTRDLINRDWRLGAGALILRPFLLRLVLGALSLECRAFLLVVAPRSCLTLSYIWGEQGWIRRESRERG